MRSDSPTEAELVVLQFVAAIVERCRGQFPRVCPSCAKRYESYADFVAETMVVSQPMQFEASSEDPLGILAFASCGGCGSTRSVRWEGDPGPDRDALRAALREDARRLGATEREVLTLLQSATRRHR